MYGVDSIFGKIYSLRDSYNILASGLSEGQEIGVKMSRKTFQYIRRRLDVPADYLILNISFNKDAVHLPIIITSSVHYKDIQLCVIQPINLPEEPYDFE